MDDCLFCKIISGDIPSIKVYEDGDVFAFLDINPINLGHTIVIPKVHATNIYEMSDASLQTVMKAVKQLSISIKKATSADGINIGMNNDRAAGQIIFHAHVHVIPRFEGDGHRHWQKKKISDDQMTDIAEKIKVVLG